MQSQNKVQLVGYLGLDPEFKEFESGKMLAIIKLATHQQYLKDGQQIESTTWHTVKAWDENALVVKKSLLKGSQAMIDGHLVNRSFEDKGGQKRYVTDIVANLVVCMDGRN